MDVVAAVQVLQGVADLEPDANGQGDGERPVLLQEGQALGPSTYSRIRKWRAVVS